MTAELQQRDDLYYNNIKRLAEVQSTIVKTLAVVCLIAVVKKMKERKIR